MGQDFLPHAVQIVPALFIFETMKGPFNAPFIAIETVNSVKVRHRFFFKFQIAWCIGITAAGFT